MKQESLWLVFVAKLAQWTTIASWLSQSKEGSSREFLDKRKRIRSYYIAVKWFNILISLNLLYIPFSIFKYPRTLHLPQEDQMADDGKTRSGDKQPTEE